MKDEQDLGRRHMGEGCREESARGARKRHPLSAGRNGPDLRLRVHGVETENVKRNAIE